MNPATAKRACNYRTGEADLLSVLEIVIAQQPRVLKGGQPNLTFFRAANEALISPDDEQGAAGFVQVEFWLALARSAGLTAIVEGSLAVTAKADAFWSLPADQRRERLQQAWLAAGDVSEFALTPEIELPGMRKTRTVDVLSDVPLPAKLIAARKAILRHIQAIKTELALPKFCMQMEENARDLFIDHSDDKSWRQVYYRGIRERGGNEDIERAGAWQRVEGSVIRLVCEMILPNLGLAAYDAARGVIEPPAELPPTQPAEVVVQPNFEVVALGEGGDASALWKLARISAPAPARRVRKYVLQRGRFANALARGFGPEELITFVASLSRTPLPQNVRYALQDWGQSTESIRIWPDALLIEAEGVEDLATTLPRALADKLQLGVLPGGHRACPMPEIAQLRPNLPPRKQLFDYSRQLPRVLFPAQGLVINAPRETLHFRARRLLELLTAQESADRYALDAAKVADTAGKLGAGDVRQRFEAALAEDAGSALNLALRSWTGEFGSVFAGPAEILVCENLDQARALASLPEFSAWVERSLSPTAYVLKAGSSDKVWAVLTKLGVKPRKGK
ncbi:MAG: hypothetical protein IT462_11995 [Planctomycetes bacterium]|nr:hypothetical protein [Planctomycetota bacterium]